MKKKYFIVFLLLSVSQFTMVECLTDTNRKAVNKNNKDVQLTQSFQKTGWLTHEKYRSVVYILTDDECKNSTNTEIEEKIKYEAYKQLQKELNPTFNRNISVQIKKLLDNFGKIEKLEKDCYGSNIYFYDIEKQNLESDFMNIKNIK